MDKLAFITGNTFVYWTSIVYCLACATAICFFLAFYLNKTGNAAAGFAAVPVSINAVSEEAIILLCNYNHHLSLNLLSVKADTK